METTNYHDLFGRVAALASITGTLMYCYSIVWSKTSVPSRSGYLIWSILGIIGILSYESTGEKETIYFAYTVGISPFLVFLLALKYGETAWDKTDTACVALACLSLILWAITGSAVTALVTILVADGLGLYPTLRKVHRNPFSESLICWVPYVVSSSLNMIAVKEWSTANVCMTVYHLTAAIIICGVIAKGQFFQKAAPA